MSNVPEEIYLEILYRVPAETTFALHQSAATYSVSYVSLSCSTNDFEDEAVDMDYPLESQGYLFKTLGVCDGLVCLAFQVGCVDLLYLWNPVTREYKELPVSPNESSESKELGVCGFGYDRRIDDYKLVKVLQYTRDVGDSYPVDRTDEIQGMSLVDVYTMGTNSWKSIESVPYSFPICGESGVLVNGALHWLGDTQALHCSLVMVTFNIGEEKFREMQLPKEPFEKKNTFVTVGVLDECLCVINSVDGGRFQIWKMLDYGVPESWNLCHLITNERITNDSFLLLVWFKNDEILFQVPGDLVFYNAKHGTARKPNIRSSSLVLIGQEMYFESLVSLNSGTYVEQYTIEED